MDEIIKLKSEIYDLIIAQSKMQNDYTKLGRIIADKQKQIKDYRSGFDDDCGDDGRGC